MKAYVSPEIEFVELEERDVITTSGACSSYSSSNYGTSCTGNHTLGGN